MDPRLILATALTMKTVTAPAAHEFKPPVVIDQQADVPATVIPGKLVYDTPRLKTITVPLVIGGTDADWRLSASFDSDGTPNEFAIAKGPGARGRVLIPVADLPPLSRIAGVFIAGQNLDGSRWTMVRAQLFTFATQRVVSLHSGGGLQTVARAPFADYLDMSTGPDYFVDRSSAYYLSIESSPGAKITSITITVEQAVIAD